MKKWIGLVAVLSLTMVLAACGSDKNADGGANKNTETPPAVTDTNGNAGNTETEGEAAAEAVTITATDYEFDKAEYRIKAGEAVDVTLVSAEGNHGIKIMNTDYTLLDKDTVSVKIDEPGEYDIICNIFCGPGHAKMKSKLIVE
ncbi:cytochrome C oxidase subunit II [Paenibacillus yanchengensis]|uniref:Cytochrome C oxidase subunit II n=1 Tax=Paenibacillus yanchengensis TaxID=2035833 RepID=A0ABW4YLL5_9BACL